MERRDVLKYTALFLGAGLSTGTIAAVMSGCKADTSDGWVPAFLTDAEAEFIRELGETILPKTKTPGAKDAQVDRFLDAIRPLRFTTDENAQFKTKLADFMQLASAELGNDFVKVPDTKKLEWVTAVDKDSYALVKDNLNSQAGERPFYLSLKEQILAGYFSSEVVAKEYFAFDPIPGTYKGCIPYADVGKSWAL